MSPAVPVRFAGDGPSGSRTAADYRDPKRDPQFVLSGAVDNPVAMLGGPLLQSVSGRFGGRPRSRASDQERVFRKATERGILMW